MSEGLCQIMRDTSSDGGCGDASSVKTSDKSLTQSQSQGSIGSCFEKPKSKNYGFLPFVRSGCDPGGDGNGGSNLMLPVKSIASEGKSSNSKKRLKIPDGGRKRLCGKCAEQGRESKLRLYQIHINEAILMCENAECTFSLSSNSVVTRDFNSIRRLRHRLPVAYRSLPSSPALSHSSGSSSQETERSSSPISQTASDSCLVRRGHRSSASDLDLFESRRHSDRVQRLKTGFSHYKHQYTSEFHGNEADDLCTLLTGIEDVDFVYAPSKPNLELADLFDMDGTDDFDIPLDKGDNLGGGPTRGQPVDQGSGDALANGSDEEVEMVIQEQEKICGSSIPDVDSQNVEQAVSSSTSGFESDEMRQGVLVAEREDSAFQAATQMLKEAEARGDAKSCITDDRGHLMTYDQQEASAQANLDQTLMPEPCSSSQTPDVHRGNLAYTEDVAVAAEGKADVVYEAEEEHVESKSNLSLPDGSSVTLESIEHYGAESSSQLEAVRKYSVSESVNEMSVEDSIVSGEIAAGADIVTTSVAGAVTEDTEYYTEAAHSTTAVDEANLQSDDTMPTTSGTVETEDTQHQMVSQSHRAESFEPAQTVTATDSMDQPSQTDTATDSVDQPSQTVTATDSMDQPSQTVTATDSVDQPSQLAAHVLSTMPQSKNELFMVSTDHSNDSSEVAMETSAVPERDEPVDQFAEIASSSTSIEQGVDYVVEENMDTDSESKSQHFPDVSQSGFQQCADSDRIQVVAASKTRFSEVTGEVGQEVSSSGLDSMSVSDDPLAVGEVAFSDSSMQQCSDIETTNPVQAEAVGGHIQTESYQVTQSHAQREYAQDEHIQTESYQVTQSHAQREYAQDEHLQTDYQAEEDTQADKDNQEGNYQPEEDTQADEDNQEGTCQSKEDTQADEDNQAENYQPEEDTQADDDNQAENYQPEEDTQADEDNQAENYQPEEDIQADEDNQAGNYQPEEDTQADDDNQAENYQPEDNTQADEDNQAENYQPEEDIQAEEITQADEENQAGNYQPEEDIQADEDTKAENYQPEEDTQAGACHTGEIHPTSYQSDEHNEAECYQAGEDNQVEGRQTGEDYQADEHGQVESYHTDTQLKTQDYEEGEDGQTDTHPNTQDYEEGEDGQTDTHPNTQDYEEGEDGRTDTHPNTQDYEEGEDGQTGMQGEGYQSEVGIESMEMASQDTEACSESENEEFVPVAIETRRITTLECEEAAQAVTSGLEQLAVGRADTEQGTTDSSATALLPEQMDQQQSAAGVLQLPATSQSAQTASQQTASSLLQASSLLRQTSLLPEQTTSSASIQQTSQQPPAQVPDAPVARILQDAEARGTGPQVVNLYVQWQNVDALCWLDVLLCPLVHSPTLTALMTPQRLQELEGTILWSLLKAYRQSQAVLQALLTRAAQQEAKFRAENPVQQPVSVPTVNIVNKANIAEIGQAVGVLYTARENIWKTMQPRLRCEKGKHDSPVFAMPLLVRENTEMKRLFTMNYRLVFACEACGYTQDDKHHKIMPSLPSVPADFSMAQPCFVRPCFHCQAPDQRMRMIFENLQDFFLLHFVSGMPHNRFHELDFSFAGSDYTVTSVVQYKRNPDHFISWIRNAPDHSWMECDDLKSVLTRFMPGQPCIPPNQVHIVMWERNLTASHARRFINTPHTNLLASLVLTVQYPSAVTPPAAAPPASSLSSPASSHSIATQSPIIQRFVGPPTRGRGGRGRGRGSHTTNIIRRQVPAAKQVIYTMSSPAPNTTSQRIVVLKTSSGGLQAISPGALTPAILEALKKQGVNIGSLKGTLVVPQTASAGVSQPVSLSNLLTKTFVSTTSATTLAAEQESNQSSEASEAAAALMSSMQEESSASTSTTLQPQTTTSAGPFQTTATPGMTSLLTQASRFVLPGQIRVTSAAPTVAVATSTTSSLTSDSAGKVHSLLSSVLTSEGQQQPLMVKQISGTTSSAKMTLGPSGGMFRIMSSGAKAIQVTPVSQGRQVVMLAQPSSSRGVNIIHSQPSSTVVSTAPRAKYQLMTKPDGTRILTQIASTSPPQPSASSMRVALEGGEGGTRLISISSPSRSYSSGVDSLSSHPCLTVTSPSQTGSMVGTPLLEARSSNIRTSIVEAVVTTGHSSNPIVISPPSLSTKARIVSVTTSGGQLTFAPVSSPESETPASQVKTEGSLLDIRHHLTFRSEPVVTKPESPKEFEAESDESENEADLDLVGLADEDWKHPRLPTIQPSSRRGRGRGGRARGRGRSRGQGRGRARGRGRGRGAASKALIHEEDLGKTATVVRSVSLTQPVGGFPPAAETQPVQDNTDSSSSLVPEGNASEMASEESIDMDISDGGQATALDDHMQKPSDVDTAGASVVTEAVHSIELGCGESMYASSQVEEDQFENTPTYEEAHDIAMEVAEQVVTSADVQMVEQEVTVGEENVDVTYNEEVVPEHLSPMEELHEESSKDVPSPSVMGRRGRRQQSGNQRGRRGRKSSSTSQSSRGRKKLAVSQASVEESLGEIEPLSPSSQNSDASNRESPVKHLASPLSSPVASPKRSPMKSPHLSPTRSNEPLIKIGFTSASRGSPEKSMASPTNPDVSSPCRDSPEKSPMSSPAKLGLFSPFRNSSEKSTAESPARQTGEIVTEEAESTEQEAVEEAEPGYSVKEHSVLKQEDIHLHRKRGRRCKRGGHRVMQVNKGINEDSAEAESTEQEAVEEAEPGYSVKEHSVLKREDIHLPKKRGRRCKRGGHRVMQVNKGISEDWEQNTCKVDSVEQILVSSHSKSQNAAVSVSGEQVVGQVTPEASADGKVKDKNYLAAETGVGGETNAMTVSKTEDFHIKAETVAVNSTEDVELAKNSLAYFSVESKSISLQSPLTATPLTGKRKRGRPPKKKPNVNSDWIKSESPLAENVKQGTYQDSGSMLNLVTSSATDKDPLTQELPVSTLSSKDVEMDHESLCTKDPELNVVTDTEATDPSCSGTLMSPVCSEASSLSESAAAEQLSGLAEAEGQKAKAVESLKVTDHSAFSVGKRAKRGRKPKRKRPAISKITAVLNIVESLEPDDTMLTGEKESKLDSEEGIADVQKESERIEASLNEQYSAMDVELAESVKSERIEASLNEQYSAMDVELADSVSKPAIVSKRRRGRPPKKGIQQPIKNETSATHQKSVEPIDEIAIKTEADQLELVSAVLPKDEEAADDVEVKTDVLSEETVENKEAEQQLLKDVVAETIVQDVVAETIVQDVVAETIVQDEIASTSKTVSGLHKKRGRPPKSSKKMVQCEEMVTDIKLEKSSLVEQKDLETVPSHEDDRFQSFPDKHLIAVKMEAVGSPKESFSDKLTVGEAADIEQVKEEVAESFSDKLTVGEAADTEQVKEEVAESFSDKLTVGEAADIEQVKEEVAESKERPKPPPRKKGVKGKRKFIKPVVALPREDLELSTEMEDLPKVDSNLQMPEVDNNFQKSEVDSNLQMSKEMKDLSEVDNTLELSKEMKDLSEVDNTLELSKEMKDLSEVDNTIELSKEMKELPKVDSKLSGQGEELNHFQEPWKDSINWTGDHTAQSADTLNVIKDSTVRVTEDSTAHSPGGESRSSRDNIFDIMSSVSPSKSNEMNDTESAELGKSSKDKEKSLLKTPKDGKQTKETVSSEDNFVKRMTYSVSRQAGDFSAVNFATPSSKKLYSNEAMHSARAKSSSDEAIVIRRRPRPLASPDTVAPPLASDISPVPPSGRTDYSQGYSSVVIKRRRPADWSASPGPSDQEMCQLSRFSHIDRTLDVNNINNPLKAEESDSFSGQSVIDDVLHGQSGQTSDASVDVENSDFVGSSSTAITASTPQYCIAAKRQTKPTERPSCGQLSRTKVRAGDVGHSVLVKTVESAGDVGHSVLVKTAESAGDVGHSVLVKTVESLQAVSSEGDQLQKQTSFLSDTDETNTFTSPILEGQSPAPLSSSIRRSSRPVVPSQRMRESDILKRRFSAGGGEPTNKKPRSVK